MNNQFDDVSGDPAWEEGLLEMTDKLPKEREPDPLLEERTIGALRQRGLLKVRSTRRFPPAWVAGGMAASIALFSLGALFGQWLGTRTTASALVSAQNGALITALQVQRAGSDYVSALQALAQSSDSLGSKASEQGREVALAAFHAAANEVVQLAPNDPVAAEILRGFQRVRQQQLQLQQRSPQRQVIWY